MEFPSKTIPLKELLLRENSMNTENLKLKT